MTVRSRRARLGARMHCPRCRFSARYFLAALIAGLLLLGPGTAFAQDDTPPSGTSDDSVRDRAVDDVTAGGTRAVPTPEPTSAPSAGEAIVAFALQYVGYPYVWAGNTPAGFDCSGFTQFVILSTLGIDIGHAVAGQPGAGAWVDYGAWQPGDLVFFQNTYEPGISHVGIYVGDGLFVHAENETTGVVISSLSSDYYAAHYWGAVRVA
jgi:cell wall-associated NlpC family hydrolase